MPATHTPSPQSVRCWLPAHVRVCSTESGAVFLDLRRNRYFGLSQEDAARLGIDGASSPRSAPVIPDCQEGAALCDELVAAGLLTRARPDVGILPYERIDLDPPAASVGLEIENRVRVRGREIMNFVGACIWAEVSIRRRSLWSIADSLNRLKQARMLESEPVVTSRTIDLVCTFRQLRPFAFTAEGQCLFHALSLARYLLAYSECSIWVIGVRTKPWGAHSWVQQGGAILDANPEAVVEYTPILVV